VRKISRFWLIYRYLTTICSPLIWVVFRLRLMRGKEHPLRSHERFGRAAVPRPAGPLVWIHGASIGEAVSAFPLISGLQHMFPGMAILVTTGTFSSAQFLPDRLPAGVLHQCSPLDIPSAVTRFLSHWQPDIALFLESEIWPNLLLMSAESGIPVALLNARLSERSFRNWQYAPRATHALFSVFQLCLAQDEANAQRFTRLGARNVVAIGNLKSSAQPLPCCESELVALKEKLGRRRRWLASSTHEGEERAVGEAHVELRKRYPDLLTLLVPRHPDRGDEIFLLCQSLGLKVARRSKGERPLEDVDCYLADTFGELGIFYRLADIVFIGATLVAKGGHNPLEAARLNCAILHGPHTEKNAASYAALDQTGAAIPVGGSRELAIALDNLLAHPSEVAKMATIGQRIAEEENAAITRILAALKPLMPSNRSAAPAPEAVSPIA
jgi:3-deoxy-D-manno-octulosonic-acid transferase